MQLQRFQMVIYFDRDSLLLTILKISACYMYDIYNRIDKQNLICWSFLIFTIDSCVQAHFFKQKQSLKGLRKFTNHHIVATYTVQQ